MKTRQIRSLYAALIPFLVGGPVHAKDPSPSDVARRFYSLANQAQCADAQGLFTAESLELMNQTLGSDGFLRFCTGRAGRAGIARLIDRDEQRKGNHALVMIERRYQDGSVALERDDLVKVDGKWKLTVVPAQKADVRK